MKTNYILILFLIMITTIGCGNNYRNSKENNQEYITIMQNYIEDKYSIEVEIVEYIFPQEGFNTELKQNVLVVRDENGVIANVKAYLGTPYEFSDNYVEMCISSKIDKEIDIDIPSGTAKSYVVVKNEDITKIDISASNVISLTYVCMIDGKPTNEILISLYEIYDKLQKQNYNDIYFLVGFTDGSPEFKKAAENYTVYGKSGWSYYSGEVYATLSVIDNDLTYEQFENKVIVFDKKNQ